MRIVFLDESTINLNDDIDFSAFDQFEEFRTYARTAPGEVAARLRSADCVVTNKVPVTRETIMSSDLKLIAVIATGYNNIDLDAAREYGLPVSNVPGYAQSSVPQHIFALLLNLVTKVDKYSADVRNGEWERSDSFTLLKYETSELAGKTIGIIGFGTIGRAVARIAESFGMQVMMNRKSGQPLDGYECSSLEQICKNADVVSLSCPLTAENRYMIDRKVLGIMKPNAILINTARGPLVNQSDLADALRNGTIAGAGIDVLDEEPPRSGNPLLGDIPNCIVTPHSAWSTVESRQRLVDETVENIKAAVNGRDRNRVC